jgi:AsmA family protein
MPLQRRTIILISAIAGISIAATAATVVGLLSAAERGTFNSTLARMASDRLERDVAFQSLDLNLLTGQPSVTLTGLTVDAPQWAGKAPLLEARRLSVGFSWGALLTGRAAARTIDLDRPIVRLVRLSPEQQSWPKGKGGGGDSLRGVRRLSITAGRFSLDDRVKQIGLSGAFDHRPEGDRPLTASARGAVRGGEIVLQARGGALNARARRAPYPFEAKVTDGEARIAISGVSDRPLSFSGFDLAVQASGPNLVVLEYLVDLGTPNSTPFAVTGRVKRTGKVTTATIAKGAMGQSDLTGTIVSDGSKDRRVLRIDLNAQTLHMRDVASVLADRPSHAVARVTPGAPTKRPPGARLLSENPLDLARFNEKDAVIRIRARRFLTDTLSPGQLSADAKLERGVFTLKPLTIDFASGRLEAALSLDLKRPDLVVGLDGKVRSNEIASLAPGLADLLGGKSNFDIQFKGTGRSWRQIGASAHGGLRLTLEDGDFQRSKASLLSGAVVQAAITALANKDARTELNCAVADADIRAGRIISRNITLVTGAGTAVIDGAVDLDRELIDLTVYGRPSGFRLFTVNSPVSVTGPLANPQTKVRLLGKGGKAALEAPKVEGDDKAEFCRRLLASPPSLTAAGPG